MTVNNNVLEKKGCAGACNTQAELLNRDCFCTTLNADQLEDILRGDDFAQHFLNAYPQLFSNTTVFISPAQKLQMQQLIHKRCDLGHVNTYSVSSICLEVIEPITKI